jgi:hypothetical protein
VKPKKPHSAAKSVVGAFRNVDATVLVSAASKKPYRTPAVKSKALTVEVGGAPYPAEMVDKVLRFKRNWCADLMHESTDSFSPVNMNALAIEYQLNKRSLREYAEYHMMIGYSCDGFCDLSEFADLEVVTPFWTREGRRPWTPK